MDSIQKWFDELYIKNSKKMISIAMRLGFPKEEVEELVHDAFLLLLSKADRFQAGHENPGGFLMESLKNLMGTRFRHKKVIQFIPYDDMPETSTTDTYFPSLKDRLPANLCEEDKLLLIARYEEQLPYAELSKRLGISPKQCAFKVFQAKKRLQRILEVEENFSGYAK